MPERLDWFASAIKCKGEFRLSDSPTFTLNKLVIVILELKMYFIIFIQFMIQIDKWLCVMISLSIYIHMCNPPSRRNEHACSSDLCISRYKEEPIYLSVNLPLPVHHGTEETGMLVHQISVYPGVRKNLSIYLSIISLPVHHVPEESGMLVHQISVYPGVKKNLSIYLSIFHNLSTMVQKEQA